MAFKFIVLLASVMVTSAVVLPQGILQPTLLAKKIVTVEAPPKYTFSYQVNDPTTGDVKSQEEARDGDLVKGVYTLIDADGLQRVVQYTSDGINGFNAVVSRTPIGKQIAVAPAVPVIKTLQPTLVQSPLTRISTLQPLSPLVKTSQLGVPLSPLGLGLGPLIG